MPGAVTGYTPRGTFTQTGPTAAAGGSSLFTDPNMKRLFDVFMERAEAKKRAEALALAAAQPKQSHSPLGGGFGAANVRSSAPSMAGGRTGPSEGGPSDIERLQEAARAQQLSQMLTPVRKYGNMGTSTMLRELDPKTGAWKLVPFGN